MKMGIVQVYKSIDGGDNWSLISNDESGFPTGSGIEGLISSF